MSSVGRRGLIFFAMLIVLGFVPGTALGLSDTVQVQAPGNSPGGEPISLSSLGDPITESYSFSSGDQNLTGYPLKSILDEAASRDSELSLRDVTAVQVDRPSQGQITIAKAEFSAGPPLFFEDSGEMKFVDPSGPRILTFTRAAPAIKLVAAAKQSVEIVALPASAKAGETVNFSAQIDGLADGENTDETWTFGDGTGEATSGKHEFAAKGTYTIRLNVVGDQGFQGTDTKTYTVGAAKKDEKKDKDNDETEDPPANGGYTDPYGGYSYPGGTGDGYGGYPGAGGSTGATPGPSAPAPATPKPEEKYEPPVDDGLITVSGELVSGSAPAATVAPGDAAPETPATVTPSSDGFGISSEAWTVIGLLTLLGLGMLVEKRGSRLT